MIILLIYLQVLWLKQNFAIEFMYFQSYVREWFSYRCFGCLAIVARYTFAFFNV
jgi:hypothetical protein